MAPLFLGVTKILKIFYLKNESVIFQNIRRKKHENFSKQCFHYSENITVQLSKDGKKITAYPRPSDAEHQRPIQPADGYLFKRMVGDAFLSITFKVLIRRKNVKIKIRPEKQHITGSKMNPVIVQLIEIIHIYMIIPF